MTGAPWPCSTCGQAGVRNVGVKGYCGEHLARLFRTFTHEVWQLNGVGLQAGVLRPEFGPLMADLECIACRATWVGVPGDACAYCRRHRALLIEHQRDLLLRQPPHPSDEDTAPLDQRLMAWGERLRCAVLSGLVTRDEAQQAWRRAVDNVVAA